MGLLVSAKGAPTPHFASCYSATRGNRTVRRPVPRFVMLSFVLTKKQPPIGGSAAPRVP